LKNDYSRSQKYPFFQYPNFFIVVGKNNPHIRVPEAFKVSGWGKLCGKNSLDLKGFGGLLMRHKSAVF